ncbi:MAG TPA: OmpA family protein [Thermoguttaceae bacterium]|nr:OmpA family protein [Thermoguttaceae bacterium]
MRRFAWAGWLLAPALAAGCAENSMVMKGQLQQSQQQQLAMTRQNQEIQTRAGALDRDNQELEALLAQSRQRGQVAEDQLNLVQQQLSGITSQLAQLRQDKEASDQQTQALTASMRRRHGVSITPNNSLLETLPAINLPDVQVRRDGDVIRIELPAPRLFEGESAQFRPDAARLITDVAAELVRSYPDQMIGVEGHTDSEPLRSGLWRNNHHLSVARAMAVYEALLTQTRLQADQLYVAGYGGNHPVVSNAPPEGRERNRRVELVVYPERRP